MPTINSEQRIHTIARVHLSIVFLKVYHPYFSQLTNRSIQRRLAFIFLSIFRSLSIAWIKVYQLKSNWTCCQLWTQAAQSSQLQAFCQDGLKLHFKITKTDGTQILARSWTNCLWTEDNNSFFWNTFLGILLWDPLLRFSCCQTSLEYHIVLHW